MNLYEQLVEILGEPVDPTIQYLYYLVCIILLLFAMKLLFSLLFDVIIKVK